MPWSVLERLTGLKAKPFATVFGKGTNLLIRAEEIGLKVVVPTLPKFGFEHGVEDEVIALPQLKIAPDVPAPTSSVPAGCTTRSSPMSGTAEVRPARKAARSWARSALKSPALSAALKTVVVFCVAVAL